ncbi:MAG: helix-turn-helix domain-containing protein [Actinobacteria bacterium]|nr:helix-turn-helix domain-containing protein [Actinomycetota bacterium]
MDSLSGVGVIDKGVLILQALRDRPLDLAGLQDACRLPRATAHRLVVALEHHHLVRRDAQGRFCLGFELVALGRIAADQFPLGEIAAPALSELRERCGESVQLYVREDDARRCVVHALRWIVPEGSLLPLDVGSAGKVLTGAPLSAGGWIESVEEREAGVASVSSPVLDGRGATVAAVGVSGPIERLTRSPGERFGPRVAEAARAITKAVAART